MGRAQKDQDPQGHRERRRRGHRPSVDEWMKKMWSKLSMEVHIWSPGHSGGKSARVTFICWVQHNLDNTTRHSLNKTAKKKGRNNIDVTEHYLALCGVISHHLLQHRLIWRTLC